MIGFIGLGIMGAPMCCKLIENGCRPLVYDIDEKAVESLVLKGAEAANLQEIGLKCELVFMILPNAAVVKEVLFGGGSLASSLKADSLVIDMSSITPADSIDAAHRLTERGVGFLDAPVSGGEPKAIDGTLVFMVGGDEQNFERAHPYFEFMGSEATLVGDCGSGSIAKLANQIIVNLNIAAVAEALTFATSAGVDPQKVYKAIRGGLAGSVVLDAKAPMMLERNFKPGGKISINHKDIGNALMSSYEIGIPMPFTSRLYEIMQYLKQSGSFEEDHSSIIKYFEALAHIKA